MPTDHSRRNVLLLATCQALMMVGTTTMIVEAALVGHMLAENKALATLPLALQQLLAMCTTIPASLIMGRIGRRLGFTIGAAFGLIGTAIAMAAIFQGSFALFCFGTALNGIYNGFAMYYRFAAADAASGAFRTKAISYVMAGGVVAAVLGPETAKLTKDLFAPFTFAGSFAVLSGLTIVAAALLQLIRIPRPSAEDLRASGRPLAEIMAQPVFIVAVLGGMIGYGGMAFVMTATPLAMVAGDHSFESAAFVIQWHALAMFAPSFVTGHIINRFGVLEVMLTGAGMLVACAAINLVGTTVPHFWIALVLLGLGWNFLFVGSTTLLTQAYRPAERSKVQAANEFLVFGTVALASLSSGALLHRFGWEAVNWGVLPAVLVTIAATLWLRFRTRAAGG